MLQGLGLSALQVLLFLGLGALGLQGFRVLGFGDEGLGF